jgi:HCOMODA/2-hydroxy-3-carboxy-muconic semialdehyde decarboxylase
LNIEDRSALLWAWAVRTTMPPENQETPVPESLADLRRDLAAAYRIVQTKAFSMPSATSACAIRKSEPLFLSRSARPAWCRPSDILEYDLDSNPIVPPVTRPYSERVIHGEIFKARPDVNAVCHHHAPAIMPFAISGVPLVPVFHLGAAMGRAAPVWDSRDEFGDTNLLVVKPEEGASLARALGKHAIVVMRAMARQSSAVAYANSCSARSTRPRMPSINWPRICLASFAADRRRGRHGGQLNLAPGPLARAYEYWVRRLAEREGRSKNDPMLRAAEAAARLPAGRQNAARKAGAKKKSRGRKS